jgi:transcriptional regulator with XRE-family HTH domain
MDRLFDIYRFIGIIMPVMAILDFKKPSEIQEVLGTRIRRIRLSRNADQSMTAAKAGISVKALRNLEAGRGSTVETLIRTLKALDALNGIEMLAPEATVNPMMLLRTHTEPQRVRRPRKKKDEANVDHRSSRME